jgi:DNA (cytosine-5)-methyltransferase 1
VTEDAICSDIREVAAAALPAASVVVASSPCQDYSEAGQRAGSLGARSGLVGEWLRLIGEMSKAGRAPAVTILENVPGILTSADGNDITEICACLIDHGYKVALLEIDAAAFVPQSRRRVFVVAVSEKTKIPARLVRQNPGLLQSAAIVDVVSAMPSAYREKMIWLDAPLPKQRRMELIDVLLPPDVAPWDDPGECLDIMMEMPELHAQKVRDARNAAMAMGVTQVGTIYRRTRNGSPVYEARFDGVAGCLRTAGGGSSVQQIIVCDAKGEVETRRLHPREAARLMGIPDSYELPETQRAAYSMAGDGVVTDVVSWLASEIIEPIVRGAK